MKSLPTGWKPQVLSTDFCSGEKKKFPGSVRLRPASFPKKVENKAKIYSEVVRMKMRKISENFTVNRSVGDDQCPGGDDQCPGGDDQCSVGDDQCPGGDDQCSVGGEQCTTRRKTCSIPKYPSAPAPTFALQTYPGPGNILESVSRALQALGWVSSADWILYGLGVSQLSS